MSHINSLSLFYKQGISLLPVSISRYMILDSSLTYPFMTLSFLVVVRFLKDKGFGL